MVTATQDGFPAHRPYAGEDEQLNDLEQIALGWAICSMRMGIVIEMQKAGMDTAMVSSRLSDLFEMARQLLVRSGR